MGLTLVGNRLNAGRGRRREGKVSFHELELNPSFVALRGSSLFFLFHNSSNPTPPVLSKPALGLNPTTTGTDLPSRANQPSPIPLELNPLLLPPSSLLPLNTLRFLDPLTMKIFHPTSQPSKLLLFLLGVRSSAVVLDFGGLLGLLASFFGERHRFRWGCWEVWRWVRSGGE